MLVDTHIHLDLKEFKADRQDVIKRSFKAGFVRLINVGLNPKSVAASMKLAEENEQIYFTAGFHPHDVKNISAADWHFLETAADHPKAVAVGETGLDFYRNISPRNVQISAFCRQLELAKKLNKPVVIHSRNAMADTLKTVRDIGLSERGGVLHCFSGNYDDLSACLELGLKISLGGPLTYRRNDELREIVKKMPLDALLLETDAPYLAPQSKRGQRNEPVFLSEVVALIAELKGLSEADVKRITTANAEKLFSLGIKIPSETIAYPIRNSLYLNITSKCSNSCFFCVRFQKDLLKGYNLFLKHEPDVEEIIRALGDLPGQYKEVVFCGYGEPTIRLDELLEVARYIKDRFKKPIRINTNGHFYLLHDKKRLNELKGLIDSLSISFNTADSEQYRKICIPRFPGDVLGKVIEFTRDARQVIPKLTITALNLPEVDIKAVAALAKELKVNFRRRKINEAG